MMQRLLGRAELARVLGLSESMTAKLRKAGLIQPVAYVGKRPGYSEEEALELRDRRVRAAAARGA